MDKIIEVCHKSGAQVGLILGDVFGDSLYLPYRLLGCPSRVGYRSSYTGVILTG